MKTLEFDGVIDDAGRLILAAPIPMAPGRVRVIVGVADAGVADADDEDVWRALVTHAWAESLNDPAEDIYTERDGLPIDSATGEVIDEPR